MGVLSGQSMTAGLISPYSDIDSQAASHDIHLGPNIIGYMSDILDIHKAESLKTQEFQLSAEGLLLRPGELYLGQSEERIYCGDYAVQIVALSSLMRIGLQVGQGSWADPGFQGNLTLELSTLSCHPIMLYPGMRIAQLVFHEVVGPIILYAGKYQNQSSPTAAKVDVNA